MQKEHKYGLLSSQSEVFKIDSKNVLLQPQPQTMEGNIHSEIIGKW